MVVISTSNVGRKVGWNVLENRNGGRVSGSRNLKAARRIGLKKPVFY